MCYVYALLNPLNSYLRCGPIAKAPYLKVNTQPIKSRGGGGGFLLCDTQINFWKSAKIHPIAQRFGHEGLVKTKLSKYIVKRAWMKLSKPF
jgi:hypothetical protein